MTVPNVKWRQQRNAEYGDRVTWFARYRGWSLYVGKRWFGGTTGLAFHAHLHRFNGGGADQPRCEQLYPTLEGAQNAAEFYAENSCWPHTKVPA